VVYGLWSVVYGQWSVVYRADYPANCLNPFQNDCKVAYFDGQKRALSAVG
jgi:hypothetical protein